MNSTNDGRVRVDLGCGTNKKTGFVGMDAIAFEGVDVIHDLRTTPWPFDDDSVDEVHCSHVFEHLTGGERCQFLDELWRILKPGAVATIITPHWSHEGAYADPTHQWPPVCGTSYLFAGASWRLSNAPHVQMTCDFSIDTTVTLDRNDTYVAVSDRSLLITRMSRSINTCVDLVAKLTKRHTG